MAAGKWIVVTGAHGGAGASTVAAALSVFAARQGRRVCLIDGHFGGGGLEVVLGVEQVQGLRWSDFIRAQGRIDMDAVMPALLQWQGVSVLSARRTMTQTPKEEAVAAILGSLPGSTTVIVDAPVAWVQHAGLPVGTRTRTVIVTGRSLVGVAGALAVKNRLGNGAGHPEARESAGLVVTSHQHRAMTPGQVAGAVGLDLWADVRNDRSVPLATELGTGPLGGRGGAKKDLGRLAQFLGLGQMGPTAMEPASLGRQ